MSNQSGEAGARRSPHTRFDTRTAYSPAASRVQKLVFVFKPSVQNLLGAVAAVGFSFKNAYSSLANQLTGIAEAYSPQFSMSAVTGAINAQQMSGLRMIVTDHNASLDETSTADVQVQSALGMPSIASPAQIGLDRILDEPIPLGEAGANVDSIAPSASLNDNVPVAPKLLSVIGQTLAGTGVEPSRPVGGVAKRLFDIVLSGTALVLLAPLLLAVYLVIRVRMGGPVIFEHERVGFNGVLFNCYKFRTMRHGAEQALDDHLAADPAAAREWRRDRKLKDDPRVTPIGILLRKTSIDELPQLWNVLRGDMSCIGPRPVVADELSRYGENSTATLAKARPGLTGLWQVSGRNLLSYESRIELDCQYVNNWSFGRDLLIIAWTVPALLDVDSTS